MKPGCSDVCEIVHERLILLGFKIDNNNEDHTDMIEALEKIKFVKVEEDNKGIDKDVSYGTHLQQSENKEGSEI